VLFSPQANSKCHFASLFLVAPPSRLDHLFLFVPLCFLLYAIRRTKSPFWIHLPAQCPRLWTPFRSPLAPFSMTFPLLSRRKRAHNAVAGKQPPPPIFPIFSTFPLSYPTLHFPWLSLPSSHHADAATVRLGMIAPTGFSTRFPLRSFPTSPLIDSVFQVSNLAADVTPAPPDLSHFRTTVCVGGPNRRPWSISLITRLFWPPPSSRVCTEI